MNNDFISREALKEQIKTELASVPQPDTDADYYVGVKQGLKLAETIIDHASTVKPCENCDLYFKAMTKEEMKKGGTE